MGFLVFLVRFHKEGGYILQSNFTSHVISYDYFGSLKTVQCFKKWLYRPMFCVVSKTRFNCVSIFEHTGCFQLSSLIYSAALEILFREI
jgi:hypothetical protein